MAAAPPDVRDLELDTRAWSSRPTVGYGWPSSAPKPGTRSAEVLDRVASWATTPAPLRARPRAPSAHGTGRKWGEVQSIFTAAQGQAVYYAELASSPSGDALLVYGIGDDILDTNLVARWTRRGRPFGPPVELTPHVNPSYVGIEAIPGGRFAVRWFDGNGVLHLLRASGRGRPFREVATWRAPADVSFRSFLPLVDGRTLLVWSTQDRNFVEPERLRAAVVIAKGKIGSPQRVAVGDLGGFALRRVGANRGALVWTERREGTKRVRIALTPR